MQPLALQFPGFLVTLELDAPLATQKALGNALPPAQLQGLLHQQSNGRTFLAFTGEGKHVAQITVSDLDGDLYAPISAFKDSAV